MRWFDKAFDELTIHELYAITALRERVFIVEQNCPYLDADGHDQASRHLWADRDGGIIAYLRVVPAGEKEFAEISIGRVIVAPEARGTGLGRDLMTRGIAACGAVPIRILAQAYLEKFYSSLGFVRDSDVFLEDGIPHVDMLRAA